MKRVTCLILLVFLVLVLSSCQPRHVADVKLGMTKDDVTALWGPTELVTYKRVNGTTLETWEYHFATTGSVCWVSFIQDRVAAPTQCRRPPDVRWYY
jgi:hypothetical protein